MHIRFIRRVFVGLIMLVAVLLPGLALAAPGMQVGPGRKEILLSCLVGLLATVLAVWLYRFAYRVFLDAHWAVDYAMGLSFVLLFLAVLTVWLATIWHLWPQHWSLLGWWLLGFLWLLVVVFGLIGHSKRG